LRVVLVESITIFFEVAATPANTSFPIVLVLITGVGIVTGVSTFPDVTVVTGVDTYDDDPPPPPPGPFVAVCTTTGAFTVTLRVMIAVLPAESSLVYVTVYAPADEVETVLLRIKLALIADPLPSSKSVHEAPASLYVSQTLRVTLVAPERVTIGDSSTVAIAFDVYRAT
jgi:hypothetical protein